MGMERYELRKKVKTNVDFEGVQQAHPYDDVGVFAGITLCGPAAQAANSLTATLSSQPVYVDSGHP